jgi:hypothetical protein
MSKFHINPDTGNVNPCSAFTGDCPFGGINDHYATAGEARAVFERDQANEQLPRSLKRFISPSETPIAASTRVFYNKYVEKMKTIAFPHLTEEEMDVLRDVGYKRPVTDEALDRIIDRLRFAGTEHLFDIDAQRIYGPVLVNYLKEVRAKSGTPSTIILADDFNPVTQTSFPKAEARYNPKIAWEEILKVAASEALYANNSATHYARFEKNSNKTGVVAEQQKAFGSAYSKMAHRLTHLKGSQLKELQWLYDNDETFRDRTIRDLSHVIPDLQAGRWRKTQIVEPVSSEEESFLEKIPLPEIRQLHQPIGTFVENLVTKNTQK